MQQHSTAVLAQPQPARQAAIAETLAQVRSLAQSQDISPEILAQAKGLLAALAAREEFFPAQEFPPQRDANGRDGIYLLSEDPDRRFALYLSVGSPGKKVPPHNHTTWAVIVGVRGDEENFFYERADDGSVPGKALLRRIGQQTVRPGEGVCMMPEDIHHIETGGQQPNWHLHLYGLALTELHTRLNFNPAEGSYKVAAITPHIIDRR